MREAGVRALGGPSLCRVLSESASFGARTGVRLIKQLIAIAWTVARRVPLSMGFSKQKYWSGLPFPPPGHLPNPGIEPTSLTSPALAGRFFTTSASWEAPIKEPGILIPKGSPQEKQVEQLQRVQRRVQGGCGRKGLRR